MQIDFHHAVTYVVARFAGFDHDRARIVAHSAQYVDDATNGGEIRFDNGAMYHRISSAHKMLDYRNLEALANHRAWIPFHFLPGNNGKQAHENVEGEFINKIVCRPNSPVAQDMVAACIADRHKAYGLHRLGIAMHVYADTWAHQGFAGVNHRINEADRIHVDGEEDQGFCERIADFFADVIVGNAFPLGHGSVLSYPDRPYLRWSYENCWGERVERDNPTDFLTAADYMCRVMQRFLEREAVGLVEDQKAVLDHHLRTIKYDSGERRHAHWLKAIRHGEFDFGPEELIYVSKGVGSWKAHAIDCHAERDRERHCYPFKSNFLSSDWKMFHDALQAHRFTVLHDILPKYGICAA